MAGSLTIRPTRPWAAIKGSWIGVFGLLLAAIAGRGDFPGGGRLLWALASLCLLTTAILVLVLRRVRVRYVFHQQRVVWHRTILVSVRVPYIDIQSIHFMRSSPREYDCLDQAHLGMRDGSWRVLRFRGFSAVDAQDIVKALSERTGLAVDAEEVGLNSRGGPRAYYP